MFGRDSKGWSPLLCPVDPSPPGSHLDGLQEETASCSSDFSCVRGTEIRGPPRPC